MRLGVIGTMVWDRIEARDAGAPVIEEWGGIAYALAAAAAARPDGWDIVPIMKVGNDLAEQAVLFCAGLPGLDVGTGIRRVAERNNRVELRYRDLERRCERMSGGVPPWTWPELEPIVRGTDALYINFISGFELDLETATALRAAYDGPIYCDLHSIFLGIEASGLRTPRALPAWADWLRCFDFVQMNEEELTLLSSSWPDPWRFAANVVGPDLRALLVTLGSRGACYVAASGVAPSPLDLRERSAHIVSPGGVTSRKLSAAAGPQTGDPTGCGDVFGATCFCALLAGASLDDALQRALDAAAINVLHRGATGLHDRLRGSPLS